MPAASYSQSDARTCREPNATQTHFRRTERGGAFAVTCRMSCVAVVLAVILVVSVTPLPWMTLAVAAQPPANPQAAPPSPPPAKSLTDPLDEIERRLGQKDLGTATQAAQSSVLEALDRWIADQKKREAAEKGASGSGSSAGRQKTTARSSADPESSEPEKDTNAPAAGSPSMNGAGQGLWGRLSGPEREAWLQSLRERGFPARYRQQLEQYYRRLSPPSANRSVEPPP